MVSRLQLYEISLAFQKQRVNLVEFIVSLLEHQTHTDGFMETLSGLYAQLACPKSLNNITAALLNNLDTSETIMSIARNVVTHEFVHELGNVLDKAEGFHLNASHINIEKILQFSRFKMAEDLSLKCPHLWRLFQLLLNTTTAKAAVLRLEACGNYLTVIQSIPSVYVLPTGDSSIPGVTINHGSEIWNVHPSMLPGRRGSSNEAKERQSQLLEVVSTNCCYESSYYSRTSCSAALLCSES
jgi:hypothetical protein